MRLETNATGTAVTEVVVDHDGATESYRAEIVVVSCGAANSARLLLASGNDKHPRGLANGSDQVGRNYMCHNNQVVLAVSKEPNPTRYQKTLGLNDFYFSGPSTDFPLGNISDGRQVAGADVPGREAHRQAGADVDAGDAGQARASTSGSAPRTCRGPRTGSRWSATAASVSATRRPTGPDQAALRAAQVDAGQPRRCTRTTWSRATST